MDAKSLESLRAGIDRTDAEILSLFRERMRICADIAAWKRANGLPIRDPAREEALLTRVSEAAGEELADEASALFQTLLSLSRSYQARLLGRSEKEKQLRCGLIGEKLGHSFSPAIHARLGDYAYRLIELRPEELEPFLRRRDFDGLNVTIPYKKAVLPLCDELTAEAERIGSVNTIVRRADGTLLGDNTDGEGFRFLLRRAGFDPAGKKALVLGSGGAAATVRAVLRELGAAEIVTVSRSGETNYVNLYERHADARLLVNATPAGMYPNNGDCLVELARLPELEAVFDLVYNPAKTRLLLDAEHLGLPAWNGLGMLAAQAAAACERFTGRKVDNNIVNIIIAELEKETKNLLLIGMPGCGKSTVGAALAEATGRRFLDCDALLAARAGKTIPAIFAEEGEEGFRRREHEILREVCKESGCVIACGGGAVTRPENLDLLRQNSTVVWLRRELARLPDEGRPLSRSLGVERLYREREPLYRAASDRIVDNDSTAEDAVRRILEAL